MHIDTYTFSFDRKQGKMRFRKDGRQVLVDQLAGQWWVQGTDRDGRITAECALVVQEQGNAKVASLYHPDVEYTPMVDGEMTSCAFDDDGTHAMCRTYSDRPFPSGTVSHWRMCYDRQAATQTDGPCWRLRDERTGEVWLISGYEGGMNVNWFDRSSHIFADDTAWVDDELIVRFGSPPPTSLRQGGASSDAHDEAEHEA